MKTLEKAIDLIEDKIEELKAEIRPLFKGNSAYEYVANQIRYNNNLLSLLKARDGIKLVCPKCGGKDVRPYKDHLCCYECGEYFKQNLKAGSAGQNFKNEL